MVRSRALLLGAALIILIGLAGLSVLVGAAGLTQPVVVGIRLPRIGAAVVAGAGLGVAGASLQGLFRSSLADGQLLGVSPAAGLGALIGYAITPGGTIDALVTVAAALAGAGFAVGFGRRGRGEILVGVALSLGLTAWLGAIVAIWDNSRVPTILYWIFGGLGGSTWTKLYLAVPLMAMSLVLLQRAARPLDLLSLGEAEARHLGVPVESVRRSVLLAAGAAVGVAVSLAGVVGFVGLLAPQLVRRVGGPSHRQLLAGSALVGASLLLGADLVARTVAAPTEIPVGLITGMVGAPVMAGLLMKGARV